jgi:hypothetical protein
MTWEYLAHPLTIAKLLWVVAAAATLWRARLCWLRIRAAQQSPAGRAASRPTRLWGRALVDVAFAMTMVALCNLLAGLSSLAIWPRPLGELSWGSFAVPAFFVTSAWLKWYAVSALDAGYRRATRPRP